ncbi:MAG: tRNA (adenosine(37)-N6)-dimethylallyltransferase MiaA [Pseudomonadota bacterium]
MDHAPLCIVGPTASGKTDLAIALAEQLDGELISVDSALVYRHLNIGSAKPDYPHHLVDVCEPEEVYSAARFVEDAKAAMDDIAGRGKRVILVGGTMLYFRALFEGLDPLPQADPQLRARFNAQAQSEGWPALHRQLEALDPEGAASIHPNHSQRLLRALELVTLTGKTLRQLHSGGSGLRSSFPQAPVFLALAPLERRVLHQRIERRFDKMLELGFLDEVRLLRKREGLSEALPAIRAVGYRQLWQHLAGEFDLQEARARALAATRQLAKRQFTWLRKWPNLQWLHTDETGQLLAAESFESQSPKIDSKNFAEKYRSKLTPIQFALRYLDDDFRSNL